MVGSSLSRFVCKGTVEKGKRQLHINSLELKAAKMAIEYLTKVKNPKRIHFQINIMVALTYLVKTRGTESEELNKTVKDVWSFLAANEITITV